MRAPAYLVAARTAAALIAQPAVTSRWTDPSALTGFTVGGLAAHLAGLVFSVSRLLEADPATEELVPLLEHYARAAWVGADLDADVNVGIRSSGEQAAAGGPGALVASVGAAIDSLESGLASLDPEFRVRPPAGPWSLTLDDFLVTRMMEIVVHSDDLATSVDLPTPPFPGEVEDPVLGLLVSLAVRRHGSLPLVRALSRAERAPATIAAF